MIIIVGKIITSMGDSETFGVEEGYGEIVIAWLNEQSKAQGVKLQARLYGHVITTKNFGNFEMFSWIGDVKTARKLINKASKKFRIKVIEGGYKPREKLFRLKKFDYAKVKKDEKTIGQLEFEVSRFGNEHWTIKKEERH